VEDPGGWRYGDGRSVLRPVLEVQLAGAEDVKILALVDSGSEHTLAAPSMARLLGVKPEADRAITLAIGGKPRRVRFTQVTLRLSPRSPSSGDPWQWRADVGFLTDWEPPWLVVLGQVGFFDEFTVSMNRRTRTLAVTPITG
jgi:hypothetical protein